ncbi:MAG: 50S ribosomal protein L24 [Actinomycetota bacterium]|nr:50S ribosomal protein L24 [Actinomycetota bacterium]
MKIRKGDRVQVMAGKDRGKTGEVIRSLPSDQKVIVAGVNIAKRHTRATGTTTQAGIIDKDMPMHVASVAIICGSCGPTRVGYRVRDDGTKVRVCRKCGGEL